MTSMINQELLNMQKNWLEICNAKELAKQYPISRPFCFAVTDEYIKSQKKIMIIGQEAAGYESYDSNLNIEKFQKDNMDFVVTQLDYERICKYNHSPFWNLFRKLKNLGLEPVWNNIDKFHRIKTIEDDGKTISKTIPLTVELEKMVDAPYGEDKKSLLKREIEIADPDIVFFVIGPSYHEALSLSLGIDDQTIYKYRPDKEHPCRNISEICEDISGTTKKIKVYWSYHPNYLNHIKAMDQCIDMMIKSN